MRLLHTSDWHLGQDFHGFPREAEHTAFLDWLADTLVSQQVDALIVAGDIYDSQNPPISAQRQLYQFIATVRQHLPRLDIVLIGGNHDSAGRLEAPGPLLDAFGVRVVGSLRRTADGQLDAETVAVPLHDADGTVRAWCAAVPFLRQADLPPCPPPQDDSEEAPDPLIWGVRQVYADLCAAVAARCTADQPLIATGHCYMTGGELSELSERRILGGNQHALPVDIFPSSVSYAALGHLHKAQRVGGRETVRYSGSPFPLSVSERAYRHQVVLVDLHGPQNVTITPLPVPRPVDILRIPAQGAAPAEQVIAAIRALPHDKEQSPDLPRGLWPYLHLAVSASGPQPGLRRDVEEALSGKAVRLARIDKVGEASDTAIAPDSLPDLEQVHPEEVFAQRYRQKFQDDPPAAYLEAFRSILEQVEHGGEPA